MSGSPLSTGNEGIPLLEVLACHAGNGEGEWRRRTYTFDASVRASAAKISGSNDPQSLLCAALAGTESLLTGEDAVLATRVGAGGVGQAEARFAASQSAQDWIEAFDDSTLPATAIFRLVAWCVQADDKSDALADACALSVWRIHDDSRLDVRFRAPLDAAGVDLLAEYVLRVLGQLICADDGVLADIALLSSAERTVLLPDSAVIGAPHDRSLTVPRLFAVMAQQHPAATAVIDGAVRLSYTDLDRRSEQLARRLRAAGVSAGEIVALVSGRSAEAIVALLAILKVGAAYLPLDGALPAERLDFMLADAQVRVALLDASTSAEGLPQRLTCIPLEGFADGIESNGGTSPPASAAIDDESLAYVMYTSGSTGTPKGVEVPHRAIIRLVRDVEYIDLGAETRMLHAAPLGFDASTLEVWGPLLNGGCVIVHREPVPTGIALARDISRHGVDTAWITAALFNAIVDKDPNHLAGLKQLLIGGEALSVAHVRRALEALPDTALINGYGPTECTTFTCTHRIARPLPANTTSIPIGRPIADTRVYVLNARGEPVPAGFVGELHIGGSGVALGYLRRQELTAERFVPDPLDESRGRVYRSGDLVRCRDDSVIEFIGRVDAQVKVRGYRIEPGEVEAALARHPDVQACAVVVGAGRDGSKSLVAYYVTPSNTLDAPQLRVHLSTTLPEFMVPAAYVRLDALPVTPNGKLDRKALPRPSRERPHLAVAYEAPVGVGETLVCQAIADLLDIERAGRHDNFFELGGDSLRALRLIERVRNASGIAVAPTVLFRDPTPAALARAIADGESGAIEARRMPRAALRPSADDAIAIVSMAVRVPGAADVETFWNNLCAGRESITYFTPDELDAGIAASTRADPAYVPARGVIADVDAFDAAFFGISPREAELTDPQQRIFLELCWECLERGGYAPDACAGPVGIFAGMYNATYFQNHVSRHPERIDKLGAFQVMLNNEKDYIATHVAHRLNLTGPAISVHTACSTSLVAIVQAMDALRTGKCDMALAGGVAVTCPPRSGYLYQEGAMLSPDGHTRSFDAEAKGTVFSDGAAVILLKPLSAALAQGDQIHALLRGGAINNDGAVKASFSAPSSDGQAAVIAMALADARVDARSVSYVETHGTATPMGDPIEIEGLTKAFRRDTADNGFCRIGSVKSNVGHLVTAAGAAGVIKTALALECGSIPPSLNYRAPNPEIDFAATPFVVNAQAADWPAGDTPRRAGVSSFGVGGTNAHVVMEQAPARPDSEPSTGAQLLLLSAKTPSALADMAERLAAHLRAQPDINLADAAWTLATGRKAFPCRAAVVADNAADAVRELRSRELHERIGRDRKAHTRDVVFMFPGQGATYPGMGRELYAAKPAFREAVDACVDALGKTLEVDLLETMFADDSQALLPTAIMQPAIFTFEYALARWWMSLGVQPAAMIGHSIGEFVAATLAGTFVLQDALPLIALRGRLMQKQPAGAMLSVRLPAHELQSRLSDTLSLAADNAPSAAVASGPAEAVEELRERLATDGIACRELKTSHAFHSNMMDAVLDPFREALERVTLREPQIPIASTAVGDWLDAGQACSADYWADHLRRPVRFAPALARLLEAPQRLLLEVGPRATLAKLARQCVAAAPSPKPDVAVVASGTDSAASESAMLRAAAGEVWRKGTTIDLAALDTRTRRRRIQLPTYPFERQRYWVDAVAESPPAQVAAAPESPPVAAAAVTDVSAPSAATAADNDRIPALIAQLREVFEDISGIDVDDADANFMEFGLDSLILTQAALQLQKTFEVKVTFRQLMTEQSSLRRLAALLDEKLPRQQDLTQATSAPAGSAPGAEDAGASAAPGGAGYLQQVIEQQMAIMRQQLALLGGVGTAQAAAVPGAPAGDVARPAPANAQAVPETVSDEDDTQAPARYDVRKAFGAIARIHTSRFDLDERQQAKLQAFIARYVKRTARSKEYTQAHRAHLADPRVVNGFKLPLKEIIYQIVVQRSKGSRLWDLDGNEYVDALNGFGMNLFGWQPDFVLEAVRKQLDSGYDIGPQHPLAGEVAQLICELTGHDRAALCNTGSEAVLGAMRMARTITGRDTIVMFEGSYHGINDEVIVRGTRKLRAVPAAPGILRNTAEHVLVLEYGTPESLQIIRERAHELAAVMVEPVQSRRPDLQPAEFLRELRTITAEAGVAFIFDEIVTGFRSHPGGTQALFGVKADIATYGKVVGGGYPIGIIAGSRAYMDALDGGHWQFGDDSMPTVGVTYFAGTFVRHPLALAAAKAVLEHLKQAGPQLQRALNERVTGMAEEMNAFCAERGAPVAIRHFASVWRVQFPEDHPLQELLFAMMRARGIHILDNFPCFLTTAHEQADIRLIIEAFKEAVAEMQECGFLPRSSATARTVMDARRPPMPGARLGREPDGRPAWFLPNPQQPGKFLKVG